MKLCNDTITVLNAVYNQETGYDEYHATVISGVSWFKRVETNISDSGLESADVTVIRIPADANFGGKSYVDPITYKGLADVSDSFTLQQGDVIVKGIVADGTHPADAHKLFYETVTILSVTDNRRASNAKHWRVTGK